MELVIAEDRVDAADVRDLLARHLEFARRVTPPGHVHALDQGGLADPDVQVFSARDHGHLVGIGALKRLDAEHAELKSMHVDPSVRGRGVGEALVVALLAEAVARGFGRVSLETGTTEGFTAARQMYRKLGFTPCQPFGNYTSNPYSICMTIVPGDGRHHDEGPGETAAPDSSTA